MSTVVIRKKIAARLKQARERAGYHSAQEFCEKNSLVLEQYLACEEGRRAVKASLAIKYCKLLNISLVWLLIGPNS